jgi:putative hemolysin
LPEIGDTVEVEGRTLTVLELDGRRIARLTVSPPPQAEDGAEVESGAAAT